MTNINPSRSDQIPSILSRSSSLKRTNHQITSPNYSSNNPSNLTFHEQSSGAGGMATGVNDPHLLNQNAGQGNPSAFLKPSASVSQLLDQLSFPATLHFLQSEWRRFNKERNEWEIEKGDLKAEIAFLQGEKRAMENLKLDLLRRVKMLEISLKQEREKSAELQKRLNDGNENEEDKEDAVPANSEEDQPQPMERVTSQAPSMPDLPNEATQVASKVISNQRSRDIILAYIKEAESLFSNTLKHSGLPFDRPVSLSPEQPVSTNISYDTSRHSPEEQMDHLVPTTSSIPQPGSSETFVDLKEELVVMEKQNEKLQAFGTDHKSRVDELSPRVLDDVSELDPEHVSEPVQQDPLDKED